MTYNFVRYSNLTFQPLSLVRAPVGAPIHATMSVVLAFCVPSQETPGYCIQFRRVATTVAANRVVAANRRLLTCHTFRYISFCRVLGLNKSICGLTSSHCCGGGELPEAAGCEVQQPPRCRARTRIQRRKHVQTPFHFRPEHLKRVGPVDPDPAQIEAVAPRPVDPVPV